MAEGLKIFTGEFSGGGYVVGYDGVNSDDICGDVGEYVGDLGIFWLVCGRTGYTSRLGSWDPRCRNWGQSTICKI